MVDAFFYLGVICEKQKDYKKAILQLKTCLQMDKEHFWACLHYATLLGELRQYQKAVKYFKHARKLNPESIPANFGYGKTLHFLTNNPEVAKEYYEFCIKKDSNHYKAFCQLGILYLEKGELETSAELLKKCVYLNPKYVLGLVTMGNLLFETGHFQNAIKYHEQALKYSPNEI